MFKKICLHLPHFCSPSIFLNSITRQQLIGKVKIEDLLSTDLALKIAAIREKFEETGIQLSEKLILQIIEINIIQWIKLINKTFY